MLLTLIVFILVLGLLVFVHELGHFLTARKMGMKVDEFGFGFPPAIFKFKKGETVYSLNWIPLGGFVNIKGENGESREDKDSFGSKKAWQRIAVLAAGVLMNFVLGAICLSIGFMVGLPQSMSTDGLDNSRAIISDRKVQIVQVLDDSPAKIAGLEAGDSVIKVNNQNIENTDQFVGLINQEPVGTTYNFEINRGDEVLTKDVTTYHLEKENKAGIGAGLADAGLVKYPWWYAIYKGFESAVAVTILIVVTFARIIKDLVVGTPIGVEISGPVGIAVMTGQVARLGLVYVLQFIAVLSLNLAVINILPLPALDGGRIIFVIIEKIRRKPVDQKVEGIIHTIGFSLLMILVLIITVQDVGRFGGKFLSFFQNIF